MKAVILAAGYGTRLGELGACTPKALLPVARETPVIDFLLERLAAIGIRDALLVTNARFSAAFEAWAARGGRPVAVSIISDGSTAPENRLGAVRDMALALDRLEPDAAAFVTASDNLYTGGFEPLVRRFEEVRSPVVAMLREDDDAVLRRSGVAAVDASGRMVLFQEKPKEPPSRYSSPPLYVYPPDIRADIAAFLADPSLDHDAPGHLVAYLVGRRPVYGVVMEGRRYDIGSLASYEEAKRAVGS